MTKGIELITKTDFLRLSSILEEEWRDDATVAMLEDKLGRASIIEPAEAPADLVTMNTQIIGAAAENGDSGQTPRTLTLVYPKEADISQGRISILAPLGVGLLGVRVGQKVAWRGLDGTVRSILIDKILYQPEASGDWHL